MRRLLILLLAVVLPLKAVGAAVLPITGSPNHEHVAHAHEAHPHQYAADHSGCAGLSGEVDADANVAHEHACPHLAMLTLVPVLPVVEADRRTPRIEQRPTRPLTSIVLDLLVPPPTAKS
jgi:hypothetical protein